MPPESTAPELSFGLKLMVKCCLTVVVWNALPATIGAQSTYTAAQADAGRLEYDRRCAECHEASDGFPRRAPALSGPGFEDRWGERRIRDLFVRMRDGMPPAGVRPRGESYTNVLAYLLRLNSVPAGATPLDPLSYEPLLRP